MAKGAKVVSRLLNRPNLGAEPVYEAPGSICFENGKGGRILVLAQKVPEQMPAYYAATFFSERYKAAMIRWLKFLEGQLPGGVCYQGVGPVTCEVGTTGEGERIVVLNALDIDGDMAPELKFDKMPASIEHLQGDGSWKNVCFEKTASGDCRLDSPILTQRAAIFRIK
jgi:hypothetical protein